MQKNTKKRNRKQKRDIYQEVTDQILHCLEEGVAPWRNPIAKGNGDGWPRNRLSGKRYRGINVFLLSMTSWAKGYLSDYWMTFKQAQSQGGQVRKGEEGTMVTFWKMYETKDKDSGEPKALPVLRHYTAFNLQQIDGVEAPDVPEPVEQQSFVPLEEAQRIVSGYADSPEIHFDGGSRAFYRVKADTVHMPKPERFDTRENYYATLFHELAHSTGASRRLDRNLEQDPQPFGSPDYGKEELVAELSASFLCAASGISPPTIEQSASYLQGWINTLKGDRRLIVSAAGAAQKSADWILGDTNAENGNSNSQREP